MGRSGHGCRLGATGVLGPAEGAGTEAPHAYHDDDRQADGYSQHHHHVASPSPLLGVNFRKHLTVTRRVDGAVQWLFLIRVLGHTKSNPVRKYRFP